jgi:hypothetical protein
MHRHPLLNYRHFWQPEPHRFSSASVVCP